MINDKTVYLVLFVVIFLGYLCLPINFNNTIDVNESACAIAINKKYPNSEVFRVRRITGDDCNINYYAVIYQIDNRFIEGCIMEGRLLSDGKRRLIPIKEVLGGPKHDKD